MLNGPGLLLSERTQKDRTKSWAIVLFIGYWVMFAAELFMVRFQRGADGLWVATTAEEPAAWLVILILSVTGISLLVSIVYAVQAARNRGRGDWLWTPSEVTGSDVLHVVAWLHVFQTCTLVLYGLVVPATLFPAGSIGSFVESASFQLFILVLVPLLLRGRLDQIGVCRPRQLGWMIVSLILLFLAVMLLLDVAVTKPVAEWFGLALDSEREKQIEQEIVHARERNGWAVLTSLVMIGGLVPLAEELLFRGVVQTFLVSRLGAVIGIFISSLWFALIHVDIALLAPLFAMGVFLGYLRHRFQSIWGAVLLHALNNMAGVLYYFQ
ncbi:CPBP family intramembrane glutamic endopeptidase [Brevibacillus borstelensis]|jgi:membrane protease YdiL (CAAX protease family)|uniref:CPBP family intramembrane glutamic endopeptidase n=1 Tax=Brevibacillus TaxID=55080 RepID=UPI0004F348D2|nr:CPBP family intramembrane glutamic endopeptidase [Brevibacillus borstelensis]KKX52745.1 metal-dependent membrane protease [Brevibacillus borstelensis cifa_chp40]NOU56601.1 CPBP family intramembrane metalloprotease [Brevibacillus borstelensis]WNF05780.1 CPBP family intramembrane metalloprotease [Brevibacillus borstelensis]